MRHMMLLTTLLATGASTAALAEDRIVPVVPERVFIPTGFDDNDNAEVVVDGIFSDTCHQATKGEFQIDAAKLTITLQPLARVSQGPCLQILVPYTYVFELGTLPEGSYRVVIAGTDMVKTMRVAESQSSGPDNELYAAIDNAYVMEQPAQGRNVIVLEGMYTNTCMVWDRTEVIRNDPAVIEVLPVVRINSGEDCKDMRFPFKGVTVELPPVESGRYLLHVRAMNGASVNRVFELGAAWHR